MTSDHPFDDVSGIPHRVGDDDLLLKGQVLAGRYRLVEEFGDQNVVATWVAQDEMLSRTVLMRLLPPGDLRTDEVLAAARAAAVATDSRFIRVLDAQEAGYSEVVSFIVSEYSHATSLAAVLAEGPLSAPCAAWLVREIADALSTMHEQSIFHSLLTPDSIVITSNGNPKIDGLLVDLALQRREPNIDDRADVLALGALLYASLTSAWPLPGQRSLPLAELRNGELPPPARLRSGVSPVLSAISMRILQPPRGAVQIESARDVANALGRILGNVEGSAELEERIQAQQMLPTIDRTPARRGLDNTETLTEHLASPEEIVDALASHRAAHDETTIERILRRVKERRAQR